MRNVRWWPAALTAAAGALALAWVWGPMSGIRQTRMVATYAVAFAVLTALLLWLLFLSRWPWRVRGAAFVLLLGAGALAAALLEIRGVTGDLAPILAWRWQTETAGPASRRPAGGSEATEVVAAPTPASASPLQRPPADDPAPAAVSEPAGRPPAAAAVGRSRQPEATPSPAALDRGYPQFLGPRRDGTVSAVHLARDWQKRPPELLWRRPVGPGWAGFAVAAGQAVTQEQRGPDELVVSYRLATGEVEWVHADRARYQTTVGGVGPRAVPTLTRDRVFTLGATGLLNALDRVSGLRLWRRDVLADNGAVSPEWGKSCSPLVVGGRVVVSAGGGGGRSLVAYDASTGELVWAGGDDASGYSSPLLATLAGVPQIVIFNAGSVAGHDPEDGRVLWRRPWPRSQPNVSMPVALPGDRLFVSSGYGVGGKLLVLTAGGGDDLAVELLWESPRLKAKFTNVVHHRGYLYGLDDGVLVCLDPATGERCWKRGRYGHGQVILAGDLLLVQAEDGEVILVEPTPEEHRELGRFQALDGKTWNPPALAGDLLLVRNDREAACYRLPLAQ